jgi:hypothetical protein
MAFAHMGSYIRLIGDDYCYAGIEASYGFFRGQIESYFHQVPYHGDRITLTLVSFLVSLLPPEVNGWIPLVTIVLLCLAIYFLVCSLAYIHHKQASKLLIVLLSVGLTFFTLLLAPTVKQSLYFRSAMLPSFAPIIFTIFLIGWLLKIKKKRWHHYLLIFMTALLNGAFSENGAAFQGMALGILLLYFIWRQMSSTDRDWREIYPTILALIGTVISVILMWSSPSISEQLITVDISLWSVIKMSLVHTADTYLGFSKTKILVVIVLLLFGGSGNLLVRVLSKAKAVPGQRNVVKLFVIILLIQLTSLLLIFSLMIPSAFTRNVYPDPRHLIGATLVMTANALVTGYFLAEVLFSFIDKFVNSFIFAFGIGAGVLIILIGVMYPVRYIPQITQERLLFQYWSRQWKLRNDEIIAAVKSGMDVVHVMKLDHIIEDVGELGLDPERNWYNQCAALYYGIEIYADQPGWEEGLNVFIDAHQ